MASDIQEHTTFLMGTEVQVSTYTYDKNRRFTVDAGTRASNVLCSFRGPESGRRLAGMQALEVAVLEWEKRWGDFPWDLAHIVIQHFTIQVLVEVRVEPR